MRTENPGQLEGEKIRPLLEIMGGLVIPLQRGRIQLFQKPPPVAVVWLWKGFSSWDAGGGQPDLSWLPEFPRVPHLGLFSDSKAITTLVPGA